MTITALPYPRSHPRRPTGLRRRLAHGASWIHGAARGHHGRWWQAGFWFVVLLIVLRLLAAPVLTMVINHKLAQGAQFRGSIDSLSLSLLAGSYEFHNLHFEVFHPETNTWSRILVIRTLACTLSWGPLLHGDVVGVLDIDHPSLAIEQKPPAGQTDVSAIAGSAGVRAPGVPQGTPPAAPQGTPPAAPPGTPQAAPPGTPQAAPPGSDDDNEPWQDRLRSLIRLRIDHCRMRDGELSYADPVTGMKTGITDINGVINGLAIGPKDHQADYHFTGTTIGNGDLHLDGEIDPLSVAPVFSVRCSLEHVNLPDINPLTSSFDHLTFKKGTFTGYAEAACDGQHINGYLKPLFHDLEIETFKDKHHTDATKIFWKVIIAIGQPLLRNDAADQHAARMPITGEVTNPRTNAWKTIGSLLRNAFIRALIPGFDSHPRMAEPPAGSLPAGITPTPSAAPSPAPPASPPATPPAAPAPAADAAGDPGAGK